jgi:hypothetical protein
LSTKLEDNSGLGECRFAFAGKNGQKRSGIAPLRLLTLASFRTWGIQQELVVPLATNIKQNSLKAIIEVILRRVKVH